eukprot:scaffold74285_cov72-Phaeocystis_antarctica.AAC.10
MKSVTRVFPSRAARVLVSVRDQHVLVALRPFVLEEARKDTRLAVTVDAQDEGRRLALVLEVRNDPHQVLVRVRVAVEDRRKVCDVRRGGELDVVRRRLSRHVERVERACRPPRRLLEQRVHHAHARRGPQWHKDALERARVRPALGDEFPLLLAHLDLAPVNRDAERVDVVHPERLHAVAGAVDPLHAAAPLRAQALLLRRVRVVVRDVIDKGVHREVRGGPERVHAMDRAPRELASDDLSRLGLAHPNALLYLLVEHLDAHSQLHQGHVVIVALSPGALLVLRQSQRNVVSLALRLGTISSHLPQAVVAHRALHFCVRTVELGLDERHPPQASRRQPQQLGKYIQPLICDHSAVALFLDIADVGGRVEGCAGTLCFALVDGALSLAARRCEAHSVSPLRHCWLELGSSTPTGSRERLFLIQKHNPKMGRAYVPTSAAPCEPANGENGAVQPRITPSNAPSTPQQPGRKC